MAQVLGARVHGLSLLQAQQRIAQLLAQPGSAHVITFGAEMAMLAATDGSYRAIVNAADLVVPDTIGIVYAAKLLGTPVPERVAGIELAEAVCEDCARAALPVFLLGAAPGVAEDAADALRQRFPGLIVAGVQDGYFNEERAPAILAQIRASGARLLFVALGFPKQEQWIQRHLHGLPGVVCIGVGGSFDVWGGRAARAPKVLRATGFEWLYRLVREPRRFRRQLALPKFALSVMSQAWHERKTRKRSAL
ncbi:MAG: WecB/TagA/CpsF family glycosyltransferase [Candidatus Eremiobacteraeota bacterium]|nr:WecB/TagA/CpsF family glycosyltransferase [Candidatus Eremiobacteraeota bacterium]